MGRFEIDVDRYGPFPLLVITSLEYIFEWMPLLSGSSSIHLAMVFAL